MDEEAGEVSEVNDEVEVEEEAETVVKVEVEDVNRVSVAEKYVEESVATGAIEEGVVITER